VTGSAPVPAAVALAAQWVRDCRRLEMRGLAEELGISRVTLFRQVGTREDLLDQALWVLAEASLEAAVQRWESRRPAGALHSPGTFREFNGIVSRSKGLRRLLDEEPTATIRVITGPGRRVRTGVTGHVEAVLRRDIAEFALVPLIEPGALAYALVRLGESFLYADVIADRQPDVDTADQLQRTLIEGVLRPAG
jgi:hypothetical protein